MATDRTLSRFSKEHLRYEIGMLFETGHRLETVGPRLDDVTRNAYIESFTTHLRTVTSFLYDSKKWEDDVISDHYVVDVAAWHKARGKRPKALQRSSERVGKEIGHLTLRRYRGRAPQKQWNIGRLLGQIARLLTRFAKHADSKRLHRDVKKLIDSLQGPPRHVEPEPPQPRWTANVVDPDAATPRASTGAFTITSRHITP